MSETNLNHIAFEFFREFARYEYCLKITGLRNDSPLKACWKSYASEVTSVFDSPQSEELKTAISYFKKHPPKKQVVINSLLTWAETLPDYETEADLILALICRVRNNLFHGGKFNGRWLEPQRSEDLLTHSLVILRACAESHPKISEAYRGST